MTEVAEKSAEVKEKVATVAFNWSSIEVGFVSARNVRILISIITTPYFFHNHIAFRFEDEREGAKQEKK